jgi:hypothetical protein
MPDPCVYLLPDQDAYRECSIEYSKHEGGRRHRASKKAHKGGKRHGNASLRAWVTFVKKVQKEEGVSYREAMMRAKKRKDKGEKWRGGGDIDNDEKSNSDDDADKSLSEVTVGGRRRRRRTCKRRGSKKHHTRRHRRSRRHH